MYDSIVNLWRHAVAKTQPPQYTHEPMRLYRRTCPTLSMFTPSKDNFNKTFIEQKDRQGRNRGRETDNLPTVQPRYETSS